MAACGGVILVAGLLWILEGSTGKNNPGHAITSLSSYISIPTDSLSTHPDSQQIAAEVNGEIITIDEWYRSVALEQALNNLAGQPPSSPEAVLERLINEKITLQVNQSAQTPAIISSGEAEVRLQELMKSWNIDEAELNSALSQAGTSRNQLLDEISRLLVMETILQSKNSQDGGQSWLKAQREQAQVSIFADLNKTPPQEIIANRPPQITDLSPVQTLTANHATPTPIASVTPIAQQTEMGANSENFPSGVNEGQLAPDFTLQLISGGNLTLSELRGHPVVLNFWASWCPVCQKELPVLQTAMTEWESQGVNVVGVNLREDATTVEKFATANNLTFPLALDTDGIVAQNYQVLGIPTAIFIDSEGVIRSRFIGPLTEEIFAERIEPLLTVKATPNETSVISQNEISDRSNIWVFKNSSYDFTLEDQSGKPLTLSAILEGQKTVLIFFKAKT